MVRKKDTDKMDKRDPLRLLVSTAFSGRSLRSQRSERDKQFVRRLLSSILRQRSRYITK